MTVYVIPIRPASTGRRIKFQYPLSGVFYTFEFLLNARTQVWTLHFSDVAESPILSGIAGRADYPLLIRSSDERLPPGQLFLLDTTGKGQDPGPNDLGARHLLCYDDREGVV